MNIEVNYIAVLIAAVASMVVGFVWYMPQLFGKEWARLSGRSLAEMSPKGPEAAKMYAISAVLALVTAYVLYHVITMSLAYFNYSPLMTGLTSAFWMWLGFVMPVQATEVLFGGKTWKLFGINTGYQLVALLVMGVVIGLLR